MDGGAASSRMRIGLREVGDQVLRVGVRPGDGSRPPLLLFNGIGANIELAEPFLAALPGPEAIIFDVPGVGGSPTPKVPYRLTTLARMGARLLDDLGYGEVDVLGVSWGGTLAQQFAHRYPARCRRLVLAATSPGHIMVPGAPSVILQMATPRRYREPGHLKRIAGEIYGGAFRNAPDLARQHLRHVRWSSDYGYYLQLFAAFGWTSLPWLRLIEQPTLVMVGTDDPLVPEVNGRILASLIPDSRLVRVDDGHLFLVTSAAASARLVADFLYENNA